MEGVRNGMNYGDFAVLYRMNAQSRIPETTMVNYGIPNKVYGGQRFYERKEIKDIMAYLRLIYNPFDDIALKRIINVPKRSIGDASIAELARVAEQEGKSHAGGSPDKREHRPSGHEEDKTLCGHHGRIYSPQPHHATFRVYMGHDKRAGIRDLPQGRG